MNINQPTKLDFDDLVATKAKEFRRVLHLTVVEEPRKGKAEPHVRDDC